MFQKKELHALVGTVILLGLVFGFNDGKEIFVFQDWLANFVTVTIMAGVAVLVHEIAHKLVAQRKDVQIAYTFWKLHRISYRKHLRYGIPIGAAIAILTTFFTNGTFYFTAIGSNTITVDEKKRLGRKYTALTEYEEALILLSGPIANILLSIFLHLVDTLSAIDLSNFITINLILAFWSMLPLPGLDGAKIFFASKNVYFFGISFLAVTFLLRNLGFFLSIFLGILIAFGILLLYYYKYE